MWHCLEKSLKHTSVPGKPHIGNNTLYSHHINVFGAEVYTESVLASTLWQLMKTAAAVMENYVLKEVVID